MHYWVSCAINKGGFSTLPRSEALAYVLPHFDELTHERGNSCLLKRLFARRPLCHKVNLPRCVARRRRFIMTCDIFGTGQTNILGLCYLFGKTYKQPTVAPLKSLKSTHSTKSRQHLLQLIETEHTISLAFKAFS